MWWNNENKYDFAVKLRNNSPDYQYRSDQYRSVLAVLVNSSHISSNWAKPSLHALRCPEGVFWDPTSNLICYAFESLVQHLHSSKVGNPPSYNTEIPYLYNHTNFINRSCVISSKLIGVRDHIFQGGLSHFAREKRQLPENNHVFFSASWQHINSHLLWPMSLKFISRPKMSNCTNMCAFLK